MENFSRNLTYALLGSLGALPAGCIGGGFVYGVWSYFLPGGMAGFWPNVGLGISVGFVAILVGIVPTFVYGAPAYAYAASRYHPSLLVALLIGVLPGLVLLALASDWAIFFLMFGAPVSVCLHFIAGHRISRHSSNNSSKPTPLRGAA